ncbi:MAG: HAD-IA family hydrolase [Burkholderiaceae bacterium]
MAAGCVIFDCDGTLVETEALECVVFADMLAALGYEITPAQVLARYRGAKKDAVIRHISEDMGRPIDADDFIARWRERSQAVFTEQLQPVVGAKDLLRHLDSSCVPYCIASNGPLSKMLLTLQITGLQPHFDHRVFSAYEVGSWKPEPGLFLHAADQMQISPARCVVVEDSEPGVHAGLAAGMQVLAYQPNVSDRPLATGVTIIRHLRDVVRYLETI